jgi:hypothetical protein
MTEEGTESQDLVTTQNTALGQATVKRDELFELHKHYEAAAKDERDFFFRYLNFYTGLLSAILAVTLTGLLSISTSSLNPPLKLTLLIGLLIGPVLTIRLSHAGIPFLSVCYRRFTQSWVTAINIRAMLGFKGRIIPGEGIQQPLYKSEYDKGFIAQFEPKYAPPLRVLKEGEKQGWSSEKVLSKLLEGSDQLMMAIRIFSAFKVAGITLGVVIIVAGLLSILLTKQ